MSATATIQWLRSALAAETKRADAEKARADDLQAQLDALTPSNLPDPSKLGGRSLPIDVDETPTPPQKKIKMTKIGETQASENAVSQTTAFIGPVQETQAHEDLDQHNADAPGPIRRPRGGTVSAYEQSLIGLSNIDTIDIRALFEGDSFLIRKHYFDFDTKAKNRTKNQGKQRVLCNQYVYWALLSYYRQRVMDCGGIAENTSEDKVFIWSWATWHHTICLLAKQIDGSNAEDCWNSTKPRASSKPRPMYEVRPQVYERRDDFIKGWATYYADDLAKGKYNGTIARLLCAMVYGPPLVT